MTGMKKNRFTEAQINGFLKQAELGMSFKEASHRQSNATQWWRNGRSAQGNHRF